MADADDGTRPGRRVSLDFRGPPLPLPGEAQSDDGSRQPLQLDTRELGSVLDRASSAPPLELDLSEVEAGAVRDAWAEDRARRSTPSPPSPDDGLEPALGPAGPSRVAAFAPNPAPGGPAISEAEDALGLVDRSRSSSPPGDLASEMRERYALDDFTGALRAAELLLGRDPDHTEARRYAESSQDKLAQHYTSRLGGAGGVPMVTVRSSDVRWLGLDHRAGFLLSRIDGAHTLEDILDMSGMPRLEALKMLTELVDAGAIRIDPRYD
ncbi:MAG: hypothetical protein ACOCXM_08795 [Myxococcota bacterium]